MKEILVFDNKEEAEAWLKETGNYGMTHEIVSHHVFIVQFHPDGVWGFSSPDELVLIPDW